MFYWLSIDLCHVRCACLAGQKNPNKKFVFCVWGGDGTGFCPALPFLCVASFFSWFCPPQFSVQSNQLFIVSLFVSRMDDFTSIRTNRDINTPTVCIHQASKRKYGISTRGTNKQFPLIYFGNNYCILSILIRGNYALGVASVRGFGKFIVVSLWIRRSFSKLLQIYGKFTFLIINIYEVKFLKPPLKWNFPFN